jgi:Tfp pilus assembly protein PilO
MASPSFTVEKPHVKFLLYGVVNLMLMAVLGSLLYGIGRLTREIVAVKQEMERLAAVVSQISMLRDSSSAAEAALTELRRILPGTDQLLFISTELETLARTSNLQFGFQYGAVEEGPPRAILFTMSLEGPLPQVARYLEALTTDLPYIMQFGNLEITGTAEGTYRAIASGKMFIR